MWVSGESFVPVGPTDRLNRENFVPVGLLAGVCWESFVPGERLDRLNGECFVPVGLLVWVCWAYFFAVEPPRALMVIVRRCAAVLVIASHWLEGNLACNSPECISKCELRSLKFCGL